MNRYRKDLFESTLKIYCAWKEYFKRQNVSGKQIVEFSTKYYIDFLFTLKNTFDELNQDVLFNKLICNQRIINSKEFIECLELADITKEDWRYIKLLKTKNYYLVWFIEQVFKFKKNIFGDRKSTYS